MVRREAESLSLQIIRWRNRRISNLGNRTECQVSGAHRRCLLLLHKAQFTSLCGHWWWHRLDGNGRSCAPIRWDAQVPRSIGVSIFESRSKFPSKECLTWESLKAASFRRVGDEPHPQGKWTSVAHLQWGHWKTGRSNSRADNSVLSPLEIGCRVVPTPALWTPQGDKRDEDFKRVILNP